MFELIVLGLILAGLAAIARAPAEKQRTENPTPPVSNLWSARTDWHRFHKPTYLRRGIVLDGGTASSNPVHGKRCPSGTKARHTSIGEAP
jgi:hypothetical protein